MRRPVVVGSLLLVVGFVAGRLWQQQPAAADGQGMGGAKYFACADANGDGKIDITDPIITLTYLFVSGPDPTC